MSINTNCIEDPDYESSIYSHSSNDTYINSENGKDCKIDDLEVANESNISENCLENVITDKDNMLGEEMRTCRDDELLPAQQFTFQIHSRYIKFEMLQCVDM